MRPSHLLLPAAASALLTTGRLPLLTINIAGLPSLLNPNDIPGDKDSNTARLGTLLSAAPYALVHVQEDFNYHAALYSTTAASFPHRTPTSGGVPFGSGLNTLSRLPFLNLQRTKWATCSSASGADCLTPKGFTFMRLTLAASGSSEAAYVDVYNLHTDAGSLADDLAGRQKNMAQVLAYINVWSVGNAVVVAGDTNSRYSRGADTGLRGFLAARFRDAWVEVERAGVVPGVGEEALCENPSGTGWCETVDKVLVRGGGVVQMGVEGFGYVGFKGEEGGVLTDHNPVGVNLTWTVGKGGFRQSAILGGPHGTRWFSDVGVLGGKGGKVKTGKVVLRGGSRLDSVGVVLGDGTRLVHGGSGGTEVVLTLGGSEFWVEAEVCQGQKDGQTRIFYLRAGTSAGRSLAAGTKTADCAVVAAPAGWQIVGFMGQDGDEVDQLALVYAPQ